MGKDRFFPVRIVEGETDLWIGIGKGGENDLDTENLESFIHQLRIVLKSYMNEHQNFQILHTPIKILPADPVLVKKMKTAAAKANVGPMASVAGAIAMETGKEIEKTIQTYEIVVENGGDIYMKILDDIIVHPFIAANESFKKMAVKIPGECKYMSVCSSSGTFGHSHSYGKADLVTVFGADTSLADAWATSIANKIQEQKDVPGLIRNLPENISAIMMIKDNSLYYKGEFELVDI